MHGKISALRYSSTSFYSKRLFFRPLTKQDMPLYFALYTNKQVMQHIGQPCSQEQTQQHFTYTLNNTNCYGEPRLTWGIIEQQTHKSIGILAFTWDLPQIDMASIGIMLLPGSQRKGYGLEAQGALSEYGFSRLLLMRIYSQFMITNKGSEQIYDKLGFIVDTNKAELKTIDNALLTKSCFLEKHKLQHHFIESYSG